MHQLLCNDSRTTNCATSVATQSAVKCLLRGPSNSLEELSEAVISVHSVPRLYKEEQLRLREYL